MRRLLLLGLLLATGLVRAENQLTIITLKYRFAQDIVTAVQPLVGPEGSVSALDNHLLIRTSPENLRAIEQAVATLDTERKMLRVTLSRSREVAQEGGGVRTSGTIKSGDITLELPGSRRSGVEVDVRRGKQFSEQRREEFINVVEGAPAVIAVGQLVPYTETWVALTRRHVSIQRTVQFEAVTTGFTVYPRVLGEQVELAIHPRISDLKSGGVIEFESLSTTIRLSLGEWVNLGGVMQSRDEVSREILSRARLAGEESSQLWVRVD